MLSLCVKTYMDTFIVYFSLMKLLVFLSENKGKGSQFFIFLEFGLIFFYYKPILALGESEWAGSVEMLRW